MTPAEITKLSYLMVVAYYGGGSPSTTKEQAASTSNDILRDMTDQEAEDLAHRISETLNKRTMSSPGETFPEVLAFIKAIRDKERHHAMGKQP